MRHHSPPEVLDVINLSIPWRNLFPHAFTDAFSIPLLTQKRMAEKKKSPTDWYRKETDKIYVKHVHSIYTKLQNRGFCNK